MRALVLALSIAVVATGLGTSASAGSRITCQCRSKPYTWIMGTNACEYHYKKPLKPTVSGTGFKPAKYCTAREDAAFRKMLCDEACSKQ
jgi:hypothetical protein